MLSLYLLCIAFIRIRVNSGVTPKSSSLLQPSFRGFKVRLRTTLLNVYSTFRWQGTVAAMKEGPTGQRGFYIHGKMERVKPNEIKV